MNRSEKRPQRRPINSSKRGFEKISNKNIITRDQIRYPTKNLKRDLTRDRKIKRYPRRYKQKDPRRYLRIDQRRD